MGTFKGPSEGGSGGKRGHRNMEHWGFNDEVKEAARSRRRLDDRALAGNGVEESAEWMRLVGDRSAQFLAEAVVEIAPAHDLAARNLKAVSTCPACDDVLFRLDDGSFAIVHLTWSGQRETPPWPRTTRLGGSLAVDLAISQHRH